MRSFLVVSLLCYLAKALPQPRADVSEYVIEIDEPEGTITSHNFPNGYSSSSSERWKFRVPGAQRYHITFDTVDLDVGGCYDYLMLYDDSNMAAPGTTVCNLRSPVTLNTDKMTISFLTASDWAAGARGSGFKITYTTFGDFPPPPSSTTAPQSTTTTTMGQTVTPTNQPPITTTTGATDPPTDPPTTVTVSTTTQGSGGGGGNFPPGNQDDSNCGVPAVEPQVTQFDYKSQSSATSWMNPGAKVVNGEEAVPHSWPWQVSLQGSYGSAYCGGTLVTEQWVVTAAHCAALIFIGTYGSDQVALGMHNKGVTESSRQLIDIVAKVSHPSYDTPDRSHDVALVRMKTPAVLNEDVSLACLAHADWTFPAGMNCVVTGWGVTVEGGNRGTNILQQAVLPLMGDEDCFDLYQQANLDTTKDMQCAGGVGKGACNGDSGGPLSCYVNDRWYHMGIVSFGEANCDTSIASIFARVAELRAFIDSVIDE